MLNTILKIQSNVQGTQIRLKSNNKEFKFLNINLITLNGLLFFFIKIIIYNSFFNDIKLFLI